MNELLGIFIDKKNGEELCTSRIPFKPSKGDVFMIDNIQSPSLTLNVQDINYLINNSSKENRCESVRLFCNKI